MISKISTLAVAVFFLGAVGAHTDKDHGKLRHWEIASVDPDRIFLTFHGDPTTRRAVSWRSAGDLNLEPYAEIAKAGRNADFAREATQVKAKTEVLDVNTARGNSQGEVNYHSVVFEGLEPDTLYAYRVANVKNYESEWIHFRTAAVEAKPFKFVYFGDAQNGVLPHWSRTIRMAYQVAPDSIFAIHAGDLINIGHSDLEWAEWFKAGGFLHSQWTGVPVTGNHEYLGKKVSKTDDNLSIQWRPQFNLPVVEDLPKELHETVYTVDYQGMQVIVLNSNKLISEQKDYLETQLKKPGFRWRVVTFHHSIFSPRRGPTVESDLMEKEWGSLFEKYNVDMVLQGHDHAYTRGELPVRENGVYTENTFQTMYVTSVSGPKQYALNPEFMASFASRGLKTVRNGENIQFFQVISADGDKLNYKAYATTGELYDEATITKDFKTGKKVISQEVPKIASDALPERGESDYWKGGGSARRQKAGK